MPTTVDVFIGRKPANYYASSRDRAAHPPERRQPALWSDVIRGHRDRALVCDIGLAVERRCDARPFATRFFEEINVRRAQAPPEEATELRDLAVLLGRHIGELRNLHDVLVNYLHQPEPAA